MVVSSGRLVRVLSVVTTSVVAHRMALLAWELECTVVAPKTTLHDTRDGSCYSLSDVAVIIVGVALVLMATVPILVATVPILLAAISILVAITILMAITILLAVTIVIVAPKITPRAIPSLLLDAAVSVGMSWLTIVAGAVGISASIGQVVITVAVVVAVVVVVVILVALIAVLIRAVVFAPSVTIIVTASVATVVAIIIAGTFVVGV